MFNEDGHLVWAAQYRTWGGIKHIFKPDNDNDQFTYTTPTGGSRQGNLAVKYDTATATATQDCPIRFQGQWEGAETGLYYNRFRYYEPLAGQYLSPDPIGIFGGLRSNGYVPNPNIWIDPWGLSCCIGPATGKLDWSDIDPNGLSRADHVMMHGNDIPTKKLQSVFADNPIKQTEEAWELAVKQRIIPNVQKNGNWEYIIPSPEAGLMGGKLGATTGHSILNNITIITKPNSNKIVTAFPSP